MALRLGKAMRRRDFIAAVAGSTAAWPVLARAQQPSPLIGFLYTQSHDAVADRLRAFQRGLKEMGYLEGENVAMPPMGGIKLIDCQHLRLNWSIVGSR